MCSFVAVKPFNSLLNFIDTHNCWCSKQYGEPNLVPLEMMHLLAYFLTCSYVDLLSLVVCQCDAL